MNGEEVKELLIRGNNYYQWRLLDGKEELNYPEGIPRYPILILTCMDPRIDVYRIFQLQPGDIYVLRNAGNILTYDVLRAILVLVFKHSIENIVVLGHTKCGMAKVDLFDMRKQLSKGAIHYLYQRGHYSVKEYTNFFKPIDNELGNLFKQVEEIRSLKGLPRNIVVTGMFYDVDTGWVFHSDDIKLLEDMEDFRIESRDLLHQKRMDFIDFLELLESEIIDGTDFEKGHLRIPEVQDETSEIVEEEPIIQVYSPVESERMSKSMEPIINGDNTTRLIPKVTIPKINIPRIKVSIPKFYKKEEGEQS